MPRKASGCREKAATCQDQWVYVPKWRGGRWQLCGIYTLKIKNYFLSSWIRIFFLNCTSNSVLPRLLMLKHECIPFAASEHWLINNLDPNFCGTESHRISSTWQIFCCDWWGLGTENSCDDNSSMLQNCSSLMFAWTI
jgi:hypothetical protein